MKVVTVSSRSPSTGRRILHRRIVAEPHCQTRRASAQSLEILPIALHRCQWCTRLDHALCGVDFAADDHRFAIDEIRIDRVEMLRPAPDAQAHPRLFEHSTPVIANRGRTDARVGPYSSLSRTMAASMESSVSARIANP